VLDSTLPKQRADGDYVMLFGAAVLGGDGFRAEQYVLDAEGASKELGLGDAHHQAKHLLRSNDLDIR
jgi:hypothetical protein